MNRTIRTLALLFVVLSLLSFACRRLSPEAVETAAPAATQPPPAVRVETQPAATQPAVTAPAATEPAPTAGAPLETAAPDTGSLVGIHLIDLNSKLEIALFEEAQASWVRFDNFHWDAIEPERAGPPVYRWETVNEAGLRAVAESGMNVIGMLLYTPAWAQATPGLACGPVAPQALEAFAEYAAAVVQRYGQPPYNVKVWEIGNEPDVPGVAVDPHSGYGCWGDPNDAGYGGGAYAEMLKVVYPAIKAADPQAQVLVGGLLLDCDPVNSPQGKDCSASRFLQGVLDAGGGAFFDGVSFHAYDYYAGELGVYGNGNWASAWNTTGPVLAAKVSYLRGLLAGANAGEKSLWNTEVAILCLPEGDPACAAEAFQQTKAAYAVQANAAALAEGLSANIWYHIRGWRGSELVDGSLQPNPAFDALAFNGAQLRGATAARQIQDYPGVSGYEIERGGERVWLLWSLDGDPHPVQLPAAPQAVYDLFGGALPAGQDLTVDRLPVYVKWGANP